MLKSKKKLFAKLDEVLRTNEFSEQGLDHPRVSNETFGRKSMVYINCGTVAARNEIEAILYTDDFKVQLEYAPQGSRVAVQVSYFKGWHWDE